MEKRVFGRERFDAFLKGLKWSTAANSADQTKAYSLVAEISCSKHPEVKLRRAAFPVHCKYGDVKACLAREQAGRQDPGTDEYCAHWSYSVEEYVVNCSDSKHVVGIVVRFDFGREVERY